MSTFFCSETLIPALTSWVQTNRQGSVLLDNEADALLMQLLLSAEQAAMLKKSADLPCTLGLYGHSHAGKIHLLKALCADEHGQLGVTLAGSSVDYFSHISLGTNATNMTVRFTAEQGYREEGFPLYLRLLRESDLVQLFIGHAQVTSDEGRVLPVARFSERLESLAARCQVQPTAAISTEEVARIVDSWQQLAAPEGSHISETQWQRFCELLPQLSVTDRAQAFSLLWGDRRNLTTRWLELAKALELLGNAETVLAPVDLLKGVVTFPFGESLFPTKAGRATTDAHVLVIPLLQEHVQPVVNVAFDILATLCAELVLTVDEAHSVGYDILFIPGYPSAQIPTLDESKVRFLVDYYRLRQQPDVMLICDAVATRSDTSQIANLLKRWAQQCQPVRADGLPDLVWAITPFDTRFHNDEHVDEVLQQLCSHLGLRWGTLQALDECNIQRLKGWLSRALTPRQRQARLVAVEQRIRTDLVDEFTSLQRTYSALQVEAKAVVRELQRQALHHGELLEALLLPLSESDLIPGSIGPSRPALFDTNIELFTEPGAESPGILGSSASQGAGVHRRWVNHIRSRTHDPRLALMLGVSGKTLRKLGEILITTSYRLELSEALEQAIQAGRAVCSVRLSEILNQFVTWLGYAQTPLYARPKSRVSQEEAIFAPNDVVPIAERLTHLPEKPTYAATRYVYDWLVALYARASENQEYHHPEDISEDARCQLRQLLSRL